MLRKSLVCLISIFVILVGFIVFSNISVKPAFAGLDCTGYMQTVSRIPSCSNGLFQWNCDGSGNVTGTACCQNIQKAYCEEQYNNSNATYSFRCCTNTPDLTGWRCSSNTSMVEVYSDGSTITDCSCNNGSPDCAGGTTCRSKTASWPYTEDAECYTPDCNTGAVYGACTGAASNTCSTNNGTKDCAYTSYTGGTDCRAVSCSSQSCTYDNCSSGYSCSGGTCSRCDYNRTFDQCGADPGACANGYAGGIASSHTVRVDEYLNSASGAVCRYNCTDLNAQASQCGNPAACTAGIVRNECTACNTSQQICRRTDCSEYICVASQADAACSTWCSSGGCSSAAVSVSPQTQVIGSTMTLSVNSSLNWGTVTWNDVYSPSLGMTNCSGNASGGTCTAQTAGNYTWIRRWTENGQSCSSNNGQTYPYYITNSAPAVNGSCSATHNNCNAGTLGATQEYPTYWAWWCNGSGGGSNILCSETKPNTDPKGNLDAADCTSFRGWTCDPDSYSSSLAVHFYRDGVAGTGTYVNQTTANVAREAAVGTACGGYSSHGYSFPTPGSLFDGTSHTIYSYAINTPSGNNPVLGGSPKTINCPLPPTPAIDTLVFPSCLTTNSYSGYTSPTSQISIYWTNTTNTTIFPITTIDIIDSVGRAYHKTDLTGLTITDGTGFKRFNGTAAENGTILTFSPGATYYLQSWNGYNNSAAPRGILTTPALCPCVGGLGACSAAFPPSWTCDRAKSTWEADWVWSRDTTGDAWCAANSARQFCNTCAPSSSPWIQTTGDVHSNTGIDASGGP